MIRAIFNLLWFILGGVLMGLAWWLVGVVAYITIVGIPWGKACFVIGQFSFFPFGKEAISRRELTGRDDVGTGSLGMIGNVIWFIFAGVWLALGHIACAIANFVTIIGIPFAIQHFEARRHCSRAHRQDRRDEGGRSRCTSEQRGGGGCWHAEGLGPVSATRGIALLVLTAFFYTSTLAR